MPGHQRKRPDASSENENGEVHCHHVPSCTKWVHRRTRNGLRMVREVPVCHSLNSGPQAHFFLFSHLDYTTNTKRNEPRHAQQQIIHLPTDLWNCGPAQVHWAFAMEREVQWCQSQIRDSRKEPFAHLTRKELHHEQLHTIMLHFDLENELDIRKRVRGDRDGPKGMTYDSCTYQLCYI